MAILKTSLGYAGLAMAAGTVLGVVREFWLRPEVGRDLAMAIELPLIVAASVGAATLALRRWPLPTDVAVRLRMGALSLALLLLAEDALSRLLRGGSVLAHWARFDAFAHTVNVAGLLAFLLIPALLAASSRRWRVSRP